MEPTIQDIFRAWYGSKWRTVAAHALGKSVATINGWIYSKRALPAWIWSRYTSDRAEERVIELRRDCRDTIEAVEREFNEWSARVRLAGAAVDARLARGLEPPKRPGRRRKICHHGRKTVLRARAAAERDRDRTD